MICSQVPQAVLVTMYCKTRYVDAERWTTLWLFRILRLVEMCLIQFTLPREQFPPKEINECVNPYIRRLHLDQFER